MAAVILGLVAVPLTEVFSSGLRTLDSRMDDYMVASKCRSMMEQLLATDYPSLTTGSMAITIRDRSVTMSWAADPYDVNGDMALDAGAYRISVSCEGMTLSTIAYDNGGAVEKIP